VCCQISDGLDWDTNTDDLSVQRAKAVYTILVAKGIAKNRLSYIGKGGTAHLADENMDGKEYANLSISQKLDLKERNENINRRVEIKIIQK
ncbi:MAG: hypothetical protein NTX03_01965, partial [Bacteroidetes bacterium]|nr:hypothetical protein [Bacteroidota bacterium]